MYMSYYKGQALSDLPLQGLLNMYSSGYKLCCKGLLQCIYAMHAYRQTARGNKTMFADLFPYSTLHPFLRSIKYTNAIFNQEQTLDLI